MTSQFNRFTPQIPSHFHHFPVYFTHIMPETRSQKQKQDDFPYSVKDFPYTIGEPYSSAWGSWSHYRGIIRMMDRLFPYSLLKEVTIRMDFWLQVAMALNVCKPHPNILSFLHSTEAEIFDGSTSKITIYIVTEPVMPLWEKIKELHLDGTQRNEYFAWGLHQISKAVSFLNNDCKLVHGNVCMDSVVVTQTLDWKLHALDVLSEFNVNSDLPNSPILQFDWLVCPQYKPLELLKSDWAAIKKSPSWSIDSWGLGCLIYELFSGSRLTRLMDLCDSDSIPQSLFLDFYRLLFPVPSLRLNPSELIDSSEYFHNKLVETIQFMETLNLKDSVEKDSFFRKLPSLAEQLPRQIVLKKLLPLLSSALEFGSASAPALTPLFKMGSWLSAEEFNVKILPTIVKLFASNDRGIRVGLLQHIDQFGESLSDQIVDEQVFPHVATGFSDTSAFLRELTLKSMQILAPKLSQRTVSGSLLNYLSNLQVDDEPAIRTNTTILLGNIATYLNEGTRKRVLINAFTVRALRDTFSPARAAGVSALSATSSYYDVTEITAHILPHIVVLSIDPDGDVRSKAFQAIDQFLLILKQHNEKLSCGDVNNLNGGAQLIPGNAGLLGWAVSSLTLKGKPCDHAPVASASANTSLPSATSNASSVMTDTADIVPVHVNPSVNAPDHPQPSSPTSVHGWGKVENGNTDEDSDKEGCDDLDRIEGQKPTPLSSIQAAQKGPIVQLHTPGSRRPKAMSKALKEEDDDLWGAIAVPKSAVKSVNTKSASDEDNLWGSIAAPSPKAARRHQRKAMSNDDLWDSVAAAPPPKAAPGHQRKATSNDDLRGSIAAPPPTSKAAILSLRRGRGAKTAPKLGIWRVNPSISS